MTARAAQAVSTDDRAGTPSSPAELGLRNGPQPSAPRSESQPVGWPTAHTPPAGMSRLAAEHPGERQSGGEAEARSGAPTASATRPGLAIRRGDGELSASRDIGPWPQRSGLRDISTEGWRARITFGSQLILDERTAGQRPVCYGPSLSRRRVERTSVA